jgi:sortase (surface protein transpeptidase)
MFRRIILLAVAALVAAQAAGAAGGRPPSGTFIMRISIPQIGVNTLVQEGDPKTNEDGFYPVHYRKTVWPGDGETVGISAHHFTHKLPGAAGGPFLRVNELHKGALIKLQVLPKYGGETEVYRVSGQKEFSCGNETITCPAARKGFSKLQQDKLILTTCIGNGSKRRFVYAFRVR